jgi:hypothetical protein
MPTELVRGRVDAMLPRVRPGRSRWTPIGLGTAFGLLLAVGAAAWLLTLPTPHTPGTDWTLTEAYPHARITDVHGYVEDGWSYLPQLFVDPQTSIGPSMSGRSGQTRLIVARNGMTQRVLRNLDAAQAPQFTGLAAAGDQIVWMEQTAGPDGQGDAAIWVADWRTGAARVLTHDTGEFVFFNSEDDLLILDGRVYWIATAPGATARSEVRSIPLAGGIVTTHTVDGAWDLIGGTWLTNAEIGGAARTELLDWRTGARVEVPTEGGELVSCAIRWCRAVALGGTGSSIRIDVLRTDGSHRSQAAAGPVTAVLVDVALSGRWELYGRSAGDDSSTTTVQLLLYDIDTKRLVVVAGGADQITGRNGYVWWATGSGDYVTWHVLDLDSLN